MNLEANRGPTAPHMDAPRSAPAHTPISLLGVVDESDLENHRWSTCHGSHIKSNKRYANK